MMSLFPPKIVTRPVVIGGTYSGSGVEPWVATSWVWRPFSPKEDRVSKKCSGACRVPMILLPKFPVKSFHNRSMARGRFSPPAASNFWAPSASRALKAALTGADFFAVNYYLLCAGNLDAALFVKIDMRIFSTFAIVCFSAGG